MNDDQAKYAVFFDDDGFQHNADNQGDFAGADLDSMIRLAAAMWPSCIPVAWAPEWPHGKRGVAVLRAESIAAGRLIELVDGKYVAHGSMTPTLDKLEAEHDPNAAMIARDGPAKPKPAAVVTEPPASTAHPCPFASFRSPDLCATSHQVDPAHQLKG